MWFCCVSDVVHRFDLWTRRRQFMGVVFIHGLSISSLATIENELVGTDLTTGLYVFVDPDTVLFAPPTGTFDGFPHFALLSVFSTKQYEDLILTPLS
jgi:hypothetical protein